MDWTTLFQTVLPYLAAKTKPHNTRLNMTDQKPAVQATKAVAIGSILPLLASSLPSPYDHYLMWVCVALASIGWAATQIDIPKDDKSKWRFVYAILQILAANYGKAMNAAVYLKGRK